MRGMVFLVRREIILRVFIAGVLVIITIIAALPHETDSLMRQISLRLDWFFPLYWFSIIPFKAISITAGP